MDLLYSAMILFYWLFLAGVIFMAGAYASRLYVTGPAGAEACLPGGRNKSLGETVTRYIFLIAALTFLVNAVHFVLHCAVMTDTPLPDVFSILPAFITKTKYGRFTVLRTLFLLAIIAVSFAGMGKDYKWTTLAGIILSLLLLVVIAMSGHQGTRGYMNFPFFLDVLHLVAVSMWIGGLIFIRFFLSSFVKGNCSESWPVFTGLINRFSRLATFCVFWAVFTGIGLSYANLGEFSLLVNSDYGIVLIMKILLVGIIMIIGGINKFSVIAGLNNMKAGQCSEGPALGGKLFTMVSLEAFLGFMVLLLTSILTHLSPAG